jgi:hypothetical protein
LIIRRKRASFLRLMKAQLDRSDFIYRSYMNGGKLFLYAKALRECNDEILACVGANVHLLPRDNRADALALIHHLNVWTALWDEAFERMGPGPSSVFSFHNHVNFPRVEVARLINLADKLK